MNVNEDIKLFTSRISDLIGRAEGGRPANTNFLTPNEVAVAKAFLNSEKPAVKYDFYGGYPEAERKMLVLFPDYADSDGFCEDELFIPIHIKASGYEKSSHSAYLGALMNCKIDRFAIGDIVLVDDGAIVFVINRIAGFLLSSEAPLERVGKDKVSLSVADKALVGSIKREYTELTFTVASERLDCLAAEIASLSREKAKALIIGGELRLNYAEVYEPSARFTVGDIISIRKSGKIKITDMQTTRKERIRVTALKYK